MKVVERIIEAQYIELGRDNVVEYSISQVNLEEVAKFCVLFTFEMETPGPH